MKKFEIKIRHNSNYPLLSDKEWRVIVDNIEHFVDVVEILCKSWTTKDLVKNDDGKMVERYHVSCTAKNVLFSTKKNISAVTIK